MIPDFDFTGRPSLPSRFSSPAHTAATPADLQYRAPSASAWSGNSGARLQCPCRGSPLSPGDRRAYGYDRGARADHRRCQHGVHPGRWASEPRQGARLHVGPESPESWLHPTINRGIRATAPYDVVLLNSDAVVTPRWLESLRIAAYSDNSIGTATAVSDNAGEFSVPKPGEFNPRPESVSAAAYARAIRHACSACRTPRSAHRKRICMFVRRDLLARIGLFDEEAFLEATERRTILCMRPSSWPRGA